MRVLLAVALVGAFGAQPEIMTLKVDGRANATPWIDARGSWVALTWSATRAQGGADVFVVVSNDGGVSFRPPVRINAVEGDARVGGELPPRVAVGGLVDGRGGSSASANASADRSDPPEIVVAWGSRSDVTEIRLARSRDGGRRFEPPTSVQAPGAKGDRGWHALVLDPRGRAHVMWLDHRGLEARTSTAHDHHKSGPDMAQFSSLYYARVGTADRLRQVGSPSDPTEQHSLAVRSANRNGESRRSASAQAEAVPSTQAGSAEREITKGVCYCCKTALAAGADGRLYAAWRHVYPGNIRDIAFTMSRDEGQTFTASSRVSSDGWEIAGCPDDGPAMGVGGDGVVHLVWPTVIGGAEPQGALFYASTRDGQTFTARQRVPTLGGPKPGHPQIALASDGQVVIAWDEIVGGVRRAATIGARATANGTLTFDRPRVLSTDMPSAYPVLARTSTGILVAWTQGPAATAAIAVRPLVPNQ